MSARDIFRLLTQGLANTDIAQQRHLTKGTVRNYTSEIFKKLGSNDRAQAAAAVLRYELVKYNCFLRNQQ